MKKRLWTSFSKILLLFVIFGLLISGFAINIQAAGAPSSITVGPALYLDGYVAGIEFGVKTIQGGGYAYCLDIHKETPENVVMYLKGEKEAGFAYLLQNGYPNKSMTGNANYDYYITQTAIWWYLDETTGSNNLPEKFKSYGEDPHGLRTYIKNLLNGALEARKKGYAKPSLSLNGNQGTLTLTSDKKYYESKAITIAGSYLSGTVAVTLSGAPSNTVVVNASTGQTQTNFHVGDQLKVRVPVGSVKNLTNTITLTAKATGSINKVYEYQPKDTSLQSLMPVVLYPVTTTLTATSKMTLDTSKVTIVKLDKNTQKPIAGATFILKDSLGKTITTWTSTTKAHTIQNLQEGTYTLEETNAPKGYKKEKEKMQFTISKSNRDITVKVYNQAIEKVVQIVKIDKETELPLAGAHLKVTDKNGKVIADFISTEEAYVIEQIKDGTYYVEELEAPEGYIKSDEKYSFTISDGTPTAQVLITNTKEEMIQEVPDTANNSSIFPTILGGVILISGIGFIYYNGKKKYE